MQKANPSGLLSLHIIQRAQLMSVARPGPGKAAGVETVKLQNTFQVSHTGVVAAYDLILRLLRDP